MSTFMFARPLATYPFIEVYEQSTGPNTLPTKLPVFPGMANKPISAAFSPDAAHSVMAMVNDLRRENLGGIGGPSENPPELGIRTFSYDDSYLFFGGSMTEAPAMYVKAGPIYVSDPTIDLSGLAGYAKLAEFSKGRRWFFVVDSNYPLNIVCYKWDDETRKYIYFHDIPSPTTAYTELKMNPGGEFLTASTASDTQFHQIEAGVEILPAMVKPTGKLVAASPDNAAYVFDTGATSLDLHLFDDELLTFSLAQTLPETAGTGRRGSFSTDSALFAYVGNVGAGASMPLFFSRDAGGVYQKASGATHSPSTPLDFAGPVFNRDSSLMMLSYAATNGSSPKVDLYVPDVLLSSAAIDNITASPNTATSVIAGTLAGDVLVVRESTTSVTVYDDVAGVWTARAALPTLPAGINSVAVSDGGNTVVLGLRASPYFATYSWDGTTWTKLANPASLPTTATFSCAISPDGAHLMLTHGGWPYLTYYGIAAGVVTKQAAPWVQSSFQPGVGFSPDSKHAVVRPTSSALVPKVYKLSGSTWNELAPLPGTGAAPSTVIFSAAWSPDGKFLTVASASDIPLAIYKLNANDTFTLIHTLSLSGETCRCAAFSPDSKALVAAFQSGDTFVRAFTIDGDTFNQVDDPTTLPSGTVNNVAWNQTSKTFLIALQTGNMMAYEYVGPSETPTMSLAVTLSPSGSGLKETWGFSPAGDTIHFGTESKGVHLYATAPWDELTFIPFEPDFPTADVTRVQYSHTGRMVLANTPDGISMASAEIGGDFINFKMVNGTFVTIYDRQGAEYVERGYIRHLEGTKLRNLTFSPSAAMFSYHATPENPLSLESNGRYLYDLSDDRTELRGVEYVAGDVNSFIAFAGTETAFVVTYDNPAEQTISYYTVQANYNFTKEDTKPVTFGPCDYSNCSTVAVAHGGNPPISLFGILADELIPKPTNISNWTSESVILDVKFTDDCDGIIVLTEDELIAMEDDPQDGLEVVSEEEFEEPVPEDTELEKTDDDVLVVVPPLPTDQNDNDQTPGQYGVGDNKHLSQISYLDYVSINVTFRAL